MDSAVEWLETIFLPCLSQMLRKSGKHLIDVRRLFITETYLGGNKQSLNSDIWQAPGQFRGPDIAEMSFHANRHEVVYINYKNSNSCYTRSIWGWKKKNESEFISSGGPYDDPRREAIIIINCILNAPLMLIVIIVNTIALSAIMKTPSLCSLSIVFGYLSLDIICSS